MLNPETGLYECDFKDCDATVKSDYWNSVKSDWFYQKDGKCWCPEHIPDWVLEWRINRGLTYHRKK